MKILIIEDEYNLADAIASMLKSKKYSVEIKTDGLTGLNEALTDIYDLIILDVMLPHKNGFEILKELKEENIKSKILMLTAKNTIDDKMIGFNSGADDYLTKPFHMEELIARVNVQLRKNKNISNDIMELGDITLNIKSMELSNKNENHKVKIIGKEFHLLELLMNNANQIMEKEQLFIKIWGYDSECDINTLEAYISFIRKKLKLVKSNIKLKAIRNMGYILEVEDEKTKE
ncbi:MAG: response regulator transcription factor [Firmicutes bacterium]|nr:response regulator transcription factor [Bacillota bacterium]